LARISPRKLPKFKKKEQQTGMRKSKGGEALIIELYGGSKEHKGGEILGERTDKKNRGSVVYTKKKESLVHLRSKIKKRRAGRTP